MDFVGSRRPLSTTVTLNTILHIEKNPKVFSDAIRLGGAFDTDGQTIRNTQKPPLEHKKIYLLPEEIPYYGDGTILSAIRALFNNICTLISGIGYQRYVGNSIWGEDKLLAKGREYDLRSEYLAAAGLDDSLESDRFNALHRLPTAELKTLTDVVIRLISEQADRQRTGEYLRPLNDETLHRLPLGDDQDAIAFAIVANPEGIWLKKINDDGFDPVKIMSLQAYNGMMMLKKINAELTAEARVAFQPYFALEEFYQVDGRSFVVSCRTRLSTAQKVLLGIQAGRVEFINDKGIQHLAAIIDEEVKNPDAEQVSKKILVEMTWLSQCLDYKKDGASPLIFMGDVADDPIKISMKIKGEAIFLAASRADIDVVAKFDKDYFLKQPSPFCSNAAYDKTTNTFFMPRGMSLDSNGNIDTPFGNYKEIQPFNPYNFVLWMNNQFLPKVNSYEYDRFINFKRDEAAIQAVANEFKMNIVFVRDDVKNPKFGNVVIINAFSGEARGNAHPVVAARIGVNNLPLSAITGEIKRGIGDEWSGVNNNVTDHSSETRTGNNTEFSSESSSDGTADTPGSENDDHVDLSLRTNKGNSDISVEDNFEEI